MWTVSPEISEPSLPTELVTITAMKAGSGPSGGGVLLPGSVVQATPQLGVVGFSAKPLKLLGAEPPLVGLSFAHCAPQKVTESPTEAFWSPMTKLPPPGAKPNPRVLHDATALLPPTSLMVVVMMNVPVVAYVCEPLTVYGPPLGPAMVPAVAKVASPQAMLAEYSAAVALVSGSVKVATVPVKLAPSVAVMVVPVAVIGCSSGGAKPPQI